MLVWDPSLEKYLAFGTLKTAALGEVEQIQIADDQIEQETIQLQDHVVSSDLLPLTALTRSSQDL